MSTGELTKKIAFAGKAATIIPDSSKMVSAADGVNKLLQVQTEMGGLVVDAGIIEDLYRLLHADQPSSNPYVHGWEIKWPNTNTPNMRVVQPVTRFSSHVHSLGFVVLQNVVYLAAEIVNITNNVGEIYFANLLHFLMVGGSISPVTFSRHAPPIPGWVRSSDVSGINRLSQIDNMRDIDRETLMDGMWRAGRHVRGLFPPDTSMVLVQPRTLNSTRTARLPIIPNITMVGEVSEIDIGNPANGPYRVPLRITT